MVCACAALSRPSGGAQAHRSRAQVCRGYREGVVAGACTAAVSERCATAGCCSCAPAQATCGGVRAQAWPPQMSPHTQIRCASCSRPSPHRWRRWAARRPSASDAPPRGREAPWGLWLTRTQRLALIRAATWAAAAALWLAQVAASAAAAPQQLRRLQQACKLQEALCSQRAHGLLRRG